MDTESGLRFGPFPVEASIDIDAYSNVRGKPSVSITLELTPENTENFFEYLHRGYPHEVSHESGWIEEWADVFIEGVLRFPKERVALIAPVQEQIDAVEAEHQKALNEATRKRGYPFLEEAPDDLQDDILDEADDVSRATERIYTLIDACSRDLHEREMQERGKGHEM